MKRIPGLILMLVLLALGTSAFAAVYPSVAFVGFDQATWTYTYRVTCPANSTYPFGRFVVMAEVPQAPPYFPWGHGADTAPTTRWLFNTADREWDDDFNPTKSNAIWQKAVLEDMIPAGTAWTGLFTLIVPNSYKVDGIVVTMDGGPGTQNPTPQTVPGPALIPEPSSLLALGGLIGGLLPLMRRRR